jgi:WD40 repeat protein
VAQQVTARLKFECKGHSGPIYTLCNGIEEATLFSAGSDKVVACWSTLTGKQTGLTIKTDAPVFSLCTLASHNILLIGLNNGSIHIIDLEARKEIKHLKFHVTSVFAIVHDIHKNQIYSSDASGNVAVINANDFSLMAVFPFGEMRIRSLQVKNNELLLARGDGKITSLETEFFNEKYSFQAHENGCNAVVAGKTGIIYSGGKDAWLKQWKNGQYMHGWPAHTSGLYDLLLHPDEEILFSASRDKTIKCWNATTLDPLLRIERKNHGGHLHSVNKLAWEPVSGLLWSAGDDRRILGWDLSFF